MFYDLVRKNRQGNNFLRSINFYFYKEEIIRRIQGDGQKKQQRKDR